MRISLGHFAKVNRVERLKKKASSKRAALFTLRRLFEQTRSDLSSELKIKRESKEQKEMNNVQAGKLSSNSDSTVEVREEKDKEARQIIQLTKALTKA